jgi:hypothetical protein
MTSHSFEKRLNHSGRIQLPVAQGFVGSNPGRVNKLCNCVTLIKDMPLGEQRRKLRILDFAPSLCFIHMRK